VKKGKNIVSSLFTKTTNKIPNNYVASLSIFSLFCTRSLRVDIRKDRSVSRTHDNSRNTTISGHIGVGRFFLFPFSRHLQTQTGFLDINCNKKNDKKCLQLVKLELLQSSLRGRHEDANQPASDVVLSLTV